MSPTEHTKDPERVAAGLKASIKNPNVSPEAKAHAQEELDRLTKEGLLQAAPGTSPRETNRVLGGYKATLHNEHTSEEAKRHAREILSAAGYNERVVDESEHTKRVLAGYKAALNNPRVSEEAKQHAREFLKQHEAYKEQQSREIMHAAGYHERVTDETEHNKRVLAGYKAALINPNVSEEAKVHAREFLQEHGVAL